MAEMEGDNRIEREWRERLQVGQQGCRDVGF